MHYCQPKEREPKHFFQLTPFDFEIIAGLIIIDFLQDLIIELPPSVYDLSMCTPTAVAANNSLYTATSDGFDVTISDLGEASLYNWKLTLLSKIPILPESRIFVLSSRFYLSEFCCMLATRLCCAFLASTSNVILELRLPA